ncbi:AgmX/PglI C-terminal domain-containing protein [Colwellia sp. MSW7]|uniref:AgmX/PglI C-terminal domain-containing protein n=1 Tax=Colwellia maritima TaxID=2912588 RepID=A0ABS9X2L7_9GAMM|nr:AgmX/PglI C-terminal domain-containing protein [Colwellia maritima]
MTTVTLPDHVSFKNSESFQRFYDLFKPNEQDKKFTIILVSLFALYFIIAVIVSFVEQVEIPREVKEQIPVQLAKIVLKEKQLPLPEKPKEPIIKEKPIDKKADEKVAEIKKEKVQESPIQPPQLTIEKRRELAKEKAKTSGLAAMKDELFAMREAFVMTPSNQSTLNATKSSEVKIKRKLLTSQVNKQASSLSAAKTSTVVNSDKLSTRNTQQIRLSETEIAANTDVLVEEQLSMQKSEQRSELSLRRTLESHKARLYARYNSALRKDPFLQGKVVFEIEIQANGKISHIDIKSSKLNNPKLERQLLVILRSITFPAENVGIVKTIWAIDFLPS